MPILLDVDQKQTLDHSSQEHSTTHQPSSPTLQLRPSLQEPTHLRASPRRTLSARSITRLKKEVEASMQLGLDQDLLPLQSRLHLQRLLPGDDVRCYDDMTTRLDAPTSPPLSAWLGPAKAPTHWRDEKECTDTPVLGLAVPSLPCLALQPPPAITPSKPLPLASTTSLGAPVQSRSPSPACPSASSPSLIPTTSASTMSVTPVAVKSSTTPSLLSSRPRSAFSSSPPNSIVQSSPLLDIGNTDAFPDCSADPVLLLRTSRERRGKENQEPDSVRVGTRRSSSHGSTTTRTIKSVSPTLASVAMTASTTTVTSPVAVATAVAAASAGVGATILIPPTTAQTLTPRSPSFSSAAKVDESAPVPASFPLAPQPMTVETTQQSAAESTMPGPANEAAATSGPHPSSLAANQPSVDGKTASHPLTEPPSTDAVRPATGVNATDRTVDVMTKVESAADRVAAEAMMYSPLEKPPISYANLILQAISESATLRLTLGDIYAWIKDRYPYYRHSSSGWQNSIRHNLSLNKAFLKLDRKIGDPGKGCFWTLHKDARAICAQTGCKKPRKAAVDPVLVPQGDDSPVSGMVTRSSATSDASPSRSSLSRSRNSLSTTLPRLNCQSSDSKPTASSRRPLDSIDSVPSPAASEDAEEPRSPRRSGRARRPPRLKEAEDFVYDSPQSLTFSAMTTATSTAGSASGTAGAGSLSTPPSSPDPSEDMRENDRERSMTGTVSSHRIRRPPPNLAEFVSSKDFRASPCGKRPVGRPPGSTNLAMAERAERRRNKAEARARSGSPSTTTNTSALSLSTAATPTSEKAQESFALGESGPLSDSSAFSRRPMSVPLSALSHSKRPSQDFSNGMGCSKKQRREDQQMGSKQRQQRSQSFTEDRADRDLYYFSKYGRGRSGRSSRGDMGEHGPLDKDEDHDQSLRHVHGRGNGNERRDKMTTVSEDDWSDSDFDFLREEEESYRLSILRIRNAKARSRGGRIYLDDNDNNDSDERMAMDRDEASHMWTHHHGAPSADHRNAGGQPGKDGGGMRLLMDPSVITYGFDSCDSQYILDFNQGPLFNNVSWPEFSDLKERNGEDDSNETNLPSVPGDVDNRTMVNLASLTKQSIVHLKDCSVTIDPETEEPVTPVTTTTLELERDWAMLTSSLGSTSLGLGNSLDSGEALLSQSSETPGIPLSGVALVEAIKTIKEEQDRDEDVLMGEAIMPLGKSQAHQQQQQQQQQLPKSAGLLLDGVVPVLCAASAASVELPGSVLKEEDGEFLKDYIGWSLCE